jgi:hypothetical protein
MECIILWDMMPRSLVEHIAFIFKVKEYAKETSSTQKPLPDYMMLHSRCYFSLA